MSTSKLDISGVFEPVQIHLPQTQLNIPTRDIRVRKTGIEFLTGKPIPQWTEMTVALHSPQSSKKIHCTGVVVECTGNRHAGYFVSIAFTNMSRQSEQRLAQLSESQTL